MRVDVRLVNVEVAVADPQGEFVADLRRENFRILEEGAPQVLTHFATVQAPVRIALLVETSPAVFLIRSDHLTAARHLLAALRPDDEVALLTYARGARVELDFTRDKRRVQSYLDNLGRYGLGMADLHLRDSVANTLEWLGAPPSRTAVIVIGTGLDTGSAIPWESLRREIGASQLTVFAVATGSLLRGEPQNSKDSPQAVDPAFAQADALLRSLANAGAGEAYFPRSAEELPQVYARIGERLRNLYSLGYYPHPRVEDGGYRRITVELLDAEGSPLVLRDPQGNPIEYRIFARKGYFARQR